MIFSRLVASLHQLHKILETVVSSLLRYSLLGLLCSCSALSTQQPKEADTLHEIDTLQKAVELQKEALLYCNNKEYQRAKSAFEKAVDTINRSPALQYPFASRILNTFAECYEKQGEYDQAKLLYQSSLKIQEKVSKENHSVYSDITITYNNLGLIYWKLGKYELAKSLFQRALFNQESTLERDHKDVAYSLNNLALIHKELGQYSEAKSLYERALIIQEKQGFEHPELATTLNNLASLYSEIGDYAEAEKLYTRALTIQEKQGFKHPEELATTLNNLASLYSEIGDYAKAEKLYTRALTIRQKELEPEHLDIACSLNNLGTLYYRLGDYKRAEPFFQRALTIISKKVSQESHPNIATSLSNLAIIYKDLGAYSQAEEYFKRALKYREQLLGSQHSKIAESLSHLAELYLVKGDYPLAESYYQRSLSIMKNVFGEEHPSTAISFNNLGVFYRILGDDKQAESLLKKAIDIQEKVLGKEHPTLAITLDNLALLYYYQTDYSRAEILYKQALSIQRKSFKENHLDIAFTLNNLARVYRDRGDYALAEPLFKQALSIQQKTINRDHPDISFTLNSLARLYKEQGDKHGPLEKARKEYSQAKALYQQALAIALKADQPELLWRIQYGLSQLLAAQNNPNAAIVFGKQSVNTIQGLRRSIRVFNKDLQRSFLRRKYDAYRHLAALLISRGRLPEAEQVIMMLKEEEYFDFIRRDRNSTDITVSEIALAALEKEYEQVSKDYIMKAYLLSKNQDNKELQDKVNQNWARYRRIEALLRKVSTHADNIVSWVKEKQKRFQGALKDLDHSAVMVHTLLTEDRLHLLVLTPEVRVSKHSDIGRDALRTLIINFREAIVDHLPTMELLAEALYTHIIAPIAEDLNQAQAISGTTKVLTLLITLDDALRNLPVAALYNRNQNKYLIENYKIIILTLATERSDITTPPSSTWQAAGFGTSQAVGGFKALDKVKEELDGIVHQNENDPDGVLDGVIYLDQAFTTSALKSALDRYPVIHIASHFDFKPGTDGESALLLGNGERLSVNMLKEDINYHFDKVELLALSACDTGRDTQANGIEIESFAKFAQDEGAKSVLATLWRVADKSTSDFMKLFYNYKQKKGWTKGDALRQAQLDFLHGTVSDILTAQRGVAQAGNSEEATSYSHPFHWAPFILFGNGL